jgi:hypothetical protein
MTPELTRTPTMADFPLFARVTTVRPLIIL